MRTVNAASLNLAEYVRANDAVVWGQACGEPLTLVELLVEQRSQLGSIQVFLGGAGYNSVLRAEHSDFIRFVGLGAVGTRRHLAKAGVLELIPWHVSKIEDAIRTGGIGCDVAMVQVSPPNERGEYSLGLTGDYVRAAVDKARVVIVEINKQVPWVRCDGFLTAADIDVAVETDRQVLQLPSAEPTELDRKIARHAFELIPERATLQMGNGSVPEAIVALLKDHRGLGIHSGMIGDGIAKLIESGVVTNEHKEIDPGIAVTGALIGSQELYKFCHNNDALCMKPISYTHDLRVVSRIRRFVSINSALQVDVTGQANAEAIGENYLGAVGGQVDYVRAANLSEGGRSILALPSTVGSGEKSRIVPRLSGPVTTPRSDVDVIVTEYGAAELRGKTLQERVKAMISIADPRHQEDIARDIRDIAGVRWSA